MRGFRGNLTGLGTFVEALNTPLELGCRELELYLYRGIIHGSFADYEIRDGWMIALMLTRHISVFLQYD